MMRYLSLIVLFFFISCVNKEDILLPKSDTTIVSDIEDHSPIYIFFRTNGKDTLAEVNRKNSIITTNWIFNIDKRLPLGIKEKAHKNEKAENYYSYADSIGKNMAFIPFTKVFYKMAKPLSGGLILNFKKNTESILIDNLIMKTNEVVDYIYGINYAVNPKIILVFDKNMSFEEYLQIKILIKELDTFNKEMPQEFIF